MTHINNRAYRSLQHFNLNQNENTNSLTNQTPQLTTPGTPINKKFWIPQPLLTLPSETPTDSFTPQFDNGNSLIHNPRHKLP